MTKKNDEELKEEEIKPSKKDKAARKEEEFLALKAQVDHWKNEYYRAYADTQNLRKEIEKDHREAMRYRIEGFVNDLLPILDSFYIVLSSPVTSPEVANYLVGFTYVYKNLMSVLENEGVSVIEPKVHDKFDASIMEAVETQEDEQEDNTVLKVTRVGYKLHERLIRPASVVVSTNKKENNENA